MKKLQKFIIIPVILLVIFFLYVHKSNEHNFSKWENGKLFAYTVDVGQADSSFFILPDGETLLIDAGNREDTALLVNFIKGLEFDKIDYVLATHPHEDHIGGMSGIIDNFEIGTFYMPDAINSTIYYEDMLDALIENEVRVRFVKRGTVIKDGECKIEILSPADEEYDELNHVSAVTKITYNDCSFLMTGDAEKRNEYDMIDYYGEALASDVIKIGHHGSATSSTKKFLSTVNPSLAIISLGADNDYGHPHKEIIERLDNLGITVLRTDVAGTILIECDGKEFYYTTEKGD